jgi:hypothetical protein
VSIAATGAASLGALEVLVDCSLSSLAYEYLSRLIFTPRICCWLE